MEWLKTQWESWWAAWREVRDEGFALDRSRETIAVPLTEYCDLLATRERHEALAVECAILRAENGRLHGMNDMLGNAVFRMVEEERENGNAAEARPWYHADISSFFRVVTKKGMDS